MTNKIKKIKIAKIIFIFAIAIFCFALYGGNKVEAYSSVEKAKKANQARINALKRKEKYEVNKLYKSQIKLEQAQKDLGKSKVNLTHTKVKLNSIEKNLHKTLREFSDIEDIASKRLNNIFKGSYLSILHLFFAAEDINTILDNIYFQQKLVEKDRIVISKMQEKASSLANLKYRKEREKRKLVYTINKIKKRKSQISSAIRVSESIIHKLRTDRATYERAQAELAKQSKNISKYLSKNKSKKVYTKNINFRKPIAGRISSPFGWRRHPIFKTRKFHSGVDIAGRNRYNVRAAGSGKVIYSGWYGGYGKVVILDHGNIGGNHVTTLYAHMYKTKVRKGQYIKKGEPVGLEGSTGYSTGPHLHFEVRLEGKPRNPLKYIR